MRKSKFSDDEIIRILNEAESPVSPNELCKRYGVSVQTFYRWRKKYGDHVEGGTRRLKQLEDENSRLRKILVEKELENHELRTTRGGRRGGH